MILEELDFAHPLLRKGWGLLYFAPLRCGFCLSRSTSFVFLYVAPLPLGFIWSLHFVARRACGSKELFFYCAGRHE
jgi:hypothetical protein